VSILPPGDARGFAALSALRQLRVAGRPPPNRKPWWIIIGALLAMYAAYRLVVG